jgi:DNA-binding response OmpR family regulator
MTTVTLKVPQMVDGEKVIKKVQHDIEPIKLFQFTKTLAAVKDILNALNEDGTVAEFFETTFAAQPELKDGKIDEKAIEEMTKQADNQFLVNAIKSFESLAVRVPDKAFELLAVLSGIEREVLDQQDILDVLDIYDAVLEANDIEGLITRLKKSLGATIGKMKFLQKRKQATA